MSGEDTSEGQSSRGEKGLEEQEGAGSPFLRLELDEKELSDVCGGQAPVRVRTRQVISRRDGLPSLQWRIVLDSTRSGVNTQSDTATQTFLKSVSQVCSNQCMTAQAEVTFPWAEELCTRAGVSPSRAEAEVPGSNV